MEKSWKAWEKYKRGSTFYLLQNLPPEERTFPHLTVCAQKTSEFQKRRDKWGYHNDRGLVKILTVNDPGMKSPMFLEESSSSKDDFWSSALVSSAYFGRVTACQTFNPAEMLLSQTRGIELRLFLNTVGIESAVVFLHTSEQTLMPSATGLYGSLSVIPAMPDRNSQDSSHVKWAMYEIKSGKVRVLDKKSLPCARNYLGDLRACVEGGFEDKAECSLPWTSESEAREEKKRTCEEAEDVAAFHQFTREAYEIPTPEGLYRATGCHFSCNYTTFDATLFGSGLLRLAGDYSSSPVLTDLNVTLLLIFTLHPHEVESREEVLLFDFLDLVGNVGGYLGLLLGWSLLSLAGTIKTRIERCIVKTT